MRDGLVKITNKTARKYPKRIGKNFEIRQNSEVVCKDLSIGNNVKIFDGVKILSEQIKIGNGVKIGHTEDFRSTSGVRLNVRSLFLGNHSRIGRSVSINGKHVEVGDYSRICDGVTINAVERFVIGKKSVIGPHFRIEGRDMRIGDDFWSGSFCWIGGGSCFEVQSKLRMGDRCHMGNYSIINTARQVIIGNEVGLGIHTSLFTHGAYLSALKGYPVSFGEIRIEDDCWLPNAIVLPNVTIGEGTVIASGAVVTKDIPRKCLAGGVPAKVLKFYDEIGSEEKSQIMVDFLKTFSDVLTDRYKVTIDKAGKDCCVLRLKPTTLIAYRYEIEKTALKEIIESNTQRAIILGLKFHDEKTSILSQFTNVDLTLIDLTDLEFSGIRDELSERVRNQLRRYGIRIILDIPF